MMYTRTVSSVCRTQFLHQIQMGTPHFNAVPALGALVPNQFKVVLSNVELKVAPEAEIPGLHLVKGCTDRIVLQLRLCSWASAPSLGK